MLIIQVDCYIVDCGRMGKVYWVIIDFQSNEERLSAVVFLENLLLLLNVMQLKKRYYKIVFRKYFLQDLN
jgi:hypothetical protein